MTNIIKINCESATFVDKHNPASNYSKFKTVSTGIVNSHSTGFHFFKSLLNFSVPKINTNKIISAYLFIYIKNIQTLGNVPESIGICGNHTNITSSNLSWDSFPEDDYTDIFHLNIPKNSSNSYIKINVTEIIKELSEYHENYNLILCPIELKSQIIVTFSSPTSDNPPYLKIQYEKSNINKDKIPSLARFVDDSNAEHDKNNTLGNKTNENDLSNVTKYSLNNLIQHTNGKQQDYNKINDSLNNILNKIALQSESISLLEKSIEETSSKYSLEDITERLTTQNESLSNLSDLLKDNILQTIHNDLSSKFSTQQKALCYLKQVFLDNSISSDFENISNIINLLKDNINNQNLNIEDIKKSINDNASRNEINNVLNLINDNNSTLSAKFNDIQEILNVLSQKSEKFNYLLNVIDTNSQTINTLLDKVNINHDSLDNITENTEMCNNNISQIKSSTDSAFVILNQLNSAISANESSLKEIPIIKKLITSLNTAIDNQLSKIDLLKTDIISSSEDRINIISQKSDDISRALNLLSTRINTIDSVMEKLNSLESSLKSNSENNKMINNHIDSLNAKITKANNNFDILSSKIQRIEDTLKNVNKSISNINLNSDAASDEALKSAIENTNIKLSDLSKVVKNISKAISEITIEPLN